MSELLAAILIESFWLAIIVFTLACCRAGK